TSPTLPLHHPLTKRTIAHPPPLALLAKRIPPSRAGLDPPRKPIGVFMLSVSSVVGTTAPSLALAAALYGGEQTVIYFNLSELQEAHTTPTRHCA
ncbi:type VI secretion system ATPase TssH, partial [Pseudomonas aeruginosa]